MWIIQIRQVKSGEPYCPGHFRDGSVPLKHSRDYTLGSDPENDFVIKNRHTHSKSVIIRIGGWERGTTDAGIRQPEVHLQLQAKTPDESSPKQIAVWEPFAGLDHDSFDQKDYTETFEQEATKASKEKARNEGKSGFFQIKHGYIVHLGPQLKLRFVWNPVIIVDGEAIGPRADRYALLNTFAIHNTAHFVARFTSFLIKKEIPADDDPDCLLALVNNVPIVAPKWLDSLYELIKVAQSTKTPKSPFELPFAPEFLPEVSSEYDDERRNAKWWLPNPKRGLIWKGKTVIMVGGKKALKDEPYFKYLGANTKRFDIMSSGKRIKNLEEFMGRANSIFVDANTYFEECVKEAKDAGQEDQDWMKDTKQHVAIAQADDLITSYESANTPIYETILQPLDAAGFPTNLADNWWMSLTNNNWRDFSRSARRDEVPETQSLPTSTADTNTINYQQSVGIPSTHPEEKDPSPPPPPPRTLQRARQGRRPISLLDGDSDDEPEPAPRPIKRVRRDLVNQVPAAKTLAPQLSTQRTVQSLSETQKSNASMGSRLQPGKSRSALLDDIGESDEDSSLGKTGKSLEAFRGLYESVKQSAGGTSAGKRVATETREEEEDFVQRSLMRQRREADRPTGTRSTSVANDNQEMEVDAPPPSTSATVRQPLHMQHVEPTRPENVTKDTEFLQAVAKARKGAKELDDFDLEFNALKIAKPKKGQTTKIYGAGLFDPSKIYNSVLDLDSDTTGNFITIERVNLFRKDKDQVDAAANQDWAGRPNFKKFKKQNVNRAPPIKLKLAPAADYGIGLDYWPDKKSKNGTEPIERSQATQSQATQSQAVTQPGPTPSNARKKRALLPVDSDDDTGIVALPSLTRDARGVTQTRNVRSTSTTRNNSVQPMSQPTASTSRGSRGSTNLLAIESDEEKPVRARRKVAPQGDASQADDVLGSAASSHNTSAASSTNKRKRLVAMDEDDEEDGLIFPGARRKKR